MPVLVFILVFTITFGLLYTPEKEVVLKNIHPDMSFEIDGKHYILRELKCYDGATGLDGC